MSPDYETILYKKKDNVLVITLNRPERYNAINIQMNADLKDALKVAKEDPGVRVIVITGAGKAFCAGADVQDFASGKFREDISEGKVTIHPYDFFKLYKPIIAAVNGVAVGFGTNLTLSCDIIYASEKASFGEFFYAWD
jgi:2-(1,2-epoxy-1,2-dihydrophenyl)acetyl-CoA isomerase